MASNPIQRRARQSFLVGFLIALIIMAVIVVLLFVKINSLNEENANLLAFTKTVYLLNTQINSGETITLSMLNISEALVEIDTSAYLTLSDFYDDEGNEIELVAKTDLSSGTPVLKDAVTTSDTVLTDDLRIVEFNMIVLPSELENGDFIDVRFSLPDGSTYIVLSKKHVEQTTSTAVWLKLTEDELSLINSAIVENYQITGSRLYAIQYTDPGLQEAAIETYYPGYDIIQLMSSNPNILDEAKTELSNKLSLIDYQAQEELRNSYKSDMSEDDIASSVESGNQEENEAISSARDEFVSALEGTGLVGSQNY